MELTTETQRTQRNPQRKERGMNEILYLCDLCASAVKNFTVLIKL